MKKQIDLNQGVHFDVRIDNDAAHITRRVYVPRHQILSFLGKYVLSADPKKILRIMNVIKNGKVIRMCTPRARKYVRTRLFDRFEEETYFSVFSRNFIPTDEGFNRVQADYNGY